MGFVAIGFDRLKARYDAAKGLLVTFPYGLYTDGTKNKPGTARIRINIVKGTVTVEN